MFWGHEEVSGWFYSKEFNYYQRANGRVVVYVQKYIGFYCVQLYIRGRLGICDIEQRTETPQTAFEMGEILLNKYEDGNREAIHCDYNSPHNPSGYWQTEYNK